MRYGRDIHCAVIVNIDQRRYLMDPGYLLHVPVPIPDDGSESLITTPMNTVILRKEGAEVFSLSTLEANVEKWRYRLKTRRITQEEFEQHWIHSFRLNSMEQVMMSRVSASGRLYFRKDRLDVVSHSQRRKTRIAASSAHELSEIFGLPSDLILNAHRSVLARTS
jgi:arylamine N-acetyltransferase